LKKIEIESLLKSFVLFFLSQAVLLGALFFIEYKKELQTYDNELFNKMRVCSFDLKCKELMLDFVQKDKYEFYKLYKNKQDISAYFSIANSQKSSLKIYITNDTYQEAIKTIKNEALVKFILVLFVVALLSLLFSLYALSPFRSALLLTEEFIKDILHDFNTPLATLRLNSSMLKQELSDNSKIKRIENAVQTILNLQTNLRAYLHNHAVQKEKFSLREFLEQRVSSLESNYKELSFSINVRECDVDINKDAFVRVIDNILSNAAKYNKLNGTVEITLEGTKLHIKDSGKGIKNPKKIFDRFYKEQERGIGIGLHIVKKLCDELEIDIDVRSKLELGTTFTLELKNII